jgi:hypothetical protein
MTNQSKRNPRALEEATEKSIREKPMSERIKEPGQNGPGLDDLIKIFPRQPHDNPRGRLSHHVDRDAHPPNCRYSQSENVAQTCPVRPRSSP